MAGVRPPPSTPPMGRPGGCSPVITPTPPPPTPPPRGVNAPPGATLRPHATPLGWDRNHLPPVAAVRRPPTTCEHPGVGLPVHPVIPRRARVYPCDVLSVSACAPFSSCARVPAQRPPRARLHPCGASSAPTRAPSFPCTHAPSPDALSVHPRVTSVQPCNVRSARARAPCFLLCARVRRPCNAVPVHARVPRFLLRDVALSVRARASVQSPLRARLQPVFLPVHACTRASSPRTRATSSPRARAHPVSPSHARPPPAPPSHFLAPPPLPGAGGLLSVQAANGRGRPAPPPPSVTSPGGTRPP